MPKVKLHNRTPLTNTSTLLVQARHLGLALCHERFSWSDGLLVNRWYLDFIGNQHADADRSHDTAYTTETDALAALRAIVEKETTA